MAVEEVHMLRMESIQDWVGISLLFLGFLLTRGSLFSKMHLLGLHLHTPSIDGERTGSAIVRGLRVDSVI